MNDKPIDESGASPEESELHARRVFLQSIGKWSGAAIVAAVGAAWFGSPTTARAAAWVNRRGVGGGGWVNGGGGGGGGWINGGGGGGGWVNRRGAGGGAWVNRR